MVGKKNKLLLALSTGVSLFAVFVASIATAAWFQLDRPADDLQSSIVTGSTEINITNVTSYKKKMTTNAKGFPVAEDSVSYLDLSTISGGSKPNNNLDGADLNFDVPENGVGYYLVVENKDHGFEYHNAYSVTKFIELDDANAHLAYTSSGVDLYTARSFRIRKYLISGNTTTSATIEISGTDKLTNAPAGTTVSHGDISIGQNGSYKVWLDYEAGKLGFERLGDPSAALNVSKSTEKPDFHLDSTKGLINYDGNKYPNRLVVVLSGLSGWSEIGNVKIGLDSLTDCSGSTVDNSYYGVAGQYFAVFDNVTSTKTTLYVKFNQGHYYGDSEYAYYYPYSGVGEKKYDGQITGLSMSPGNVYQLSIAHHSSDGGWWETGSYEDGNGGSGNGTHKFNKWFTYSMTKGDDLVRTVQISTDNGTNYSNMTYNSGNEWKYTLASSTDSQKIKFKLNGTVQGSLVRKTDSESAFNKNNCTVSGDTVTLTYGSTASVTVYYDIISKKVWIDQVFKLKVGSNYFLLLKQSDKQYKATYYGNQGDTVAICNSGNSNSVSFNLDGDTYNNVKLVSSVKTLQKTISSGSPASAFFNNQGTEDTRPDVPTSSSTLWMDGNKNYRVGYRYGTSGSFTYSDMSYDESTGKYKLSGLALTYKATNAKLNFQINEADINGTNSPSISKDTGTGSSNDQDYYVYNNVSSVSGSIASVTYGGTVDVYYDTSSGKIIVTPVYSTKITSGGTLKQATGTGDLRTATRTATSLTASEDDTVYVYVNNSTAYSYTLAPAENAIPNNLTDGHAIKSIGRNASASVNVKIYVRTTVSGSRTVYVTGFVDYEYYLTVTHANSSTNGYSMSLYSGQMKASSVPVVAGDKLTFQKNYKALAATAENASRNNVENNDGITVLCDGTVDVYLKNYTTTPVVWVTGFKTKFYFYNSDPDLASSQRFYVIFSGGNKTYVQMSQDGTDPRLHYYDYDADDGTHMIISTTSGGTGTASAQVDISSLSLDTHPYATYTTSGSGTGKTLKWYEHGPQTGGSKYYVYGGYSKAYAWNTTSESNTKGTYMPFGGFRYPGANMTAVISGSLYVIDGVNPTIYDKILFTNGSDNTADLTTSGNANKIYIQASASWANEKTDESYGTATIHVMRGNSDVNTYTMSIGDNGNRSSNYFIYEHGAEAQHGDYLWVEVSRGEGNLGNKVICDVSDGIYTPRPGDYGIYYNYDDAREFVSMDGDNPKRPYLTVTQTADEGSHKGIQVNIGTGNSARFNFYVMKTGKLAVVMVPDYGNGFYIMDYTSTTEGFIGATKMKTLTATSATYDSFYANSGSTPASKKKIFIRSYMDAVDKDYTDSNIVIDESASGKVTKSGAVITFEELGYYNIEVMGDKVYISKPGTTDYTTLNPLDLNNAGSQSAIKAQDTSIVLEVQFTTSNNAFQLSSDLLVTNQLSTYVGVSYYVTDTAEANPYTFMRGDTIYNAMSTGSTISNSNSSFRTTAGTSSKVYYAYILIDYKYSGSLSGLAVEPVGNLSFFIRTTQA